MHKTVTTSTPTPKITITTRPVTAYCRSHLASGGWFDFANHRPWHPSGTWPVLPLLRNSVVIHDSFDESAALTNGRRSPPDGNYRRWTTALRDFRRTTAAVFGMTMDEPSTMTPNSDTVNSKSDLKT